MAKQDIFSSAVEDEDDDAPQVQANEPAPEPADEEAAAPQPPEGQEPQAAESAAQPDQPQPQPQQHLVPLNELLTTRERAQMAEQKAKELERRIEDFERQQRAAQAKPAEVPDVFADPNAYTQHMQSAFQQSIQEMRLDMDLRLAEVRYGDAFKEAFQAFVGSARQNPAIYHQVMASASPGEAIVEWNKRESVLREVGSDPAAYRQKLQDELLSDPAFLQQVVERVRQPSAAPSQGTRPQSSVRLPPSLQRAPSASARDEDVDGSRDGIWTAATRGR